METAGDCYIVAGALMSVDEDGFLALEEQPDARMGAEQVMAFSKVSQQCIDDCVERRLCSEDCVERIWGAAAAQQLPSHVYPSI